MALAVATAGADVVVSSRRLAAAQEAAEDIGARTGVRTLGVALDVCDENSVAEAAGRIAAEMGAPHILINNAGGTCGDSPRHLFERSPQDIRNMLDLNLLGPILCTREFAPAMVSAGYGKIVNIASVAGLVGRDREVYRTSGLPEQPVEYAAVKAGVIGFTVDCAALFARNGVRVNAISPGGFRRDGMPGAFEQSYSERTALGRMGDSEARDLEGAVIFLASAASDYVTGHNLVVDGGFHFWK